ncbi:LysR family transcriptional regulator [Streptomyces sp. NBC_00459]|uniref:LysR family transcriptional regulator n=1 Tax=Streptomyces sp. NBC_00459 TaxID=2975749 RepID=UPI002E198750
MPEKSTLRNLDLNLLQVLDVLLREVNVTRAAERLGLSQPAVSGALGRLRRHFNDDLLIRLGNQYHLSPLAMELSKRTSVALRSVADVFSLSSAFDPLTSEREFDIVLSDYASAVLGQAISMELAGRAPRARLRLRQVPTREVKSATAFLRTLHGVVLPHGPVTGLPHINLYKDTWVCMVAAKNNEVGDTLTTAQLSRMPWVTVRECPKATDMLPRLLASLGVVVREQVRVGCYREMPHFVASTDRVALFPARLAARTSPTAGVRFLPCPLNVVPLVEALWWHPMYEQDPAHHWLRSLVHDAARTVVEDSAAPSETPPCAQAGPTPDGGR